MRRFRVLVIGMLALATLGSPALAGDIAGTAGGSDARRGSPTPGQPLLLFLRSGEMRTTRRSGPLTIARDLAGGRIVPGSPGPATKSFDVLRVADVVVLTNREGSSRRLFAFAGAVTRDLGVVEPGGSTSIRLDAGGPLEIYSDPPGGSSSYLFVAENPFFQEIEAGHPFLMDGVPPGRYELCAWRPGGPVTVTRVEVPYEGRVTARLRLR